MKNNLKKNLYFDNNASTPLDPRVVEEIKSLLSYPTLNPSSPHKAGQIARGKLDLARREAASYFGVLPHEVIFTSSGTEAMNFLLKSALARREGAILSSDTEHSAVYNVVKARPSSIILKGVPTPEEVERALTPEVSVIALMAVNNETGVKTDIEAIGRIALANKVTFIVDGVAWLGKEEVVLPPGVSGIGFSGHKVHAPGGVGCALFRAPFKPVPLIVGGAQEFGARGGTENMIGIIAFAKALTLLKGVDYSAIRKLRERFESALLSRLPSIKINGLSHSRTSNVSNILFPGEEGESLMMKLDQAGLACSLGSACTSGALEPSRVLLSMGLSYKEAKSSLRFSFSRMNTEEEIDEAVELITALF